MSSRLEKALYYAGAGGDVASLKALARQEERTGEQMRRLLACALLAGGPVRVPCDLIDKLTREGGLDGVTIEVVSNPADSSVTLSAKQK
jgi:hypothetical protein